MEYQYTFLWIIPALAHLLKIFLEDFQVVYLLRSDHIMETGRSADMLYHFFGMYFSVNFTLYMHFTSFLHSIKKFIIL